MGLFSLFQKKRKQPDETVHETNTENVDITLEEVDFSKLTAQDRNRYVEEQCEIILECNNNVETAKKEYKTVSAYFSDIQIIEGQPVKIRDRITYLAKSIVELAVDRKMLFTEEKKISGSRYLQLQQEEDTIVDGIKNLKNNELYLQVVKKDMSALTGEKAALKIETRELLNRQAIIKNITIVSLVCFVIIFSVFIVAQAASGDDYSTWFYLVLFLAAVFAAGDILLYRRTIYNIMITEKKVNKTIALHNKEKIKYINVRNLIEYQYEKYGVKSSYELADLYQRYLETKATREKYRKATMELSDSEEELEELLESLGLYDSKIWLSQVKALCEPKEMVEIRHEYSVRRQGLRKLIEENSERAEVSKAALRKIISDYPGFAGEVLQIVEKYDD
ncbi:MAG: hypothetical protein PUF12_09460 [Thermoflexaceae bacterium]|nr:hypothetical protein [Thermoflexaceae bacterium]